jgi:predicted TIM-barrel fold metal-dependent hydrolase
VRLLIGFPARDREMEHALECGQFTIALGLPCPIAIDRRANIRPRLNERPEMTRLPSLAVAAFVAAAAASANDTAFGQRVSRYQGPVIDMHLHANGALFADRQYCFPQPCEGAPTKAKSLDEVKPMTLAAMERNRIVMGVISGPLDSVLSWTDAEPGRFRTGVTHPSRVPIGELEQLFRSGRLQILGEMNEQYAGIPIDDPALDPLFAMAHRLDIPVHVHVSGAGGSVDFPSHLGNPLRMVPVLRKYQGLRIYFENAAWPFLEEITAVMYQYPQVNADVSTILHLMPRSVALKYVRGLVENWLAKRIMFGSDQMIWPEVIDVAVDSIQSADFLTLDQKADIFYNNAARFLKLSDEQIARHHAR